MENLEKFITIRRPDNSGILNYFYALPNTDICDNSILLLEVGNILEEIEKDFPDVHKSRISINTFKNNIVFTFLIEALPPKNTPGYQDITD